MDCEQYSMNDNAGLEPVPVAAHDGLLALFQTRPLFHRSGFSAVLAMPRISEVESSAIVTIVCQTS
jgi:hypothetical protein